MDISCFRRFFGIKDKLITADIKIIFIPAVVVAENKAAVLFFVSTRRAIAHVTPVHEIFTVCGRKRKFNIEFYAVLLVPAEIGYSIGANRRRCEKSFVFYALLRFIGAV